jgi:hypothetical protein
MSRAEDLFTVEMRLRNAATLYAANQTAETRKALRAAAVEYADMANDLDFLVDPPEAKTP